MCEKFVELRQTDYLDFVYGKEASVPEDDPGCDVFGMQDWIREVVRLRTCTVLGHYEDMGPVHICTQMKVDSFNRLMLMMGWEWLEHPSQILQRSKDDMMKKEYGDEYNDMEVRIDTGDAGFGRS